MITEKDSTERLVLESFVKRLQHTAVKHIAANESFLLFLDDHAPRKHPG